MKNSALALVCLLVGGATGYGLRSMSGGGGEGPAPAESVRVKGTKGGRAPDGAGAADETSGRAGAGTARASAAATKGISLADRMKELLVDFDVKSAQKGTAKLSAGDLQAALALVADLPKSADRDALRGQLYRAWAALNPSAAWQAALADPLDKNKGSLLGAVAGELAKTNPAAAIDLALSLGMGGRRSTVLTSVFGEWSKVDAAAAVAYSNAHPDLPVDSFAFSRGLSLLAEKEPMKAANLVVTFKEDLKRKVALSSLMNTWVDSDPGAALNWAQALTNPTTRQDAVAAAVGAWAKIDPAAALAHAQGIPDADTRTNSIKKAWTDWFRNNPTAATSYLATATDEKLLQTLSWDFAYYSESYTPKERAGLLAMIPEGKIKEDLFRSVTDSQIRKGQFNQALEMLNAMPDSSDRDRSVQKLGQEWAASDLDAASKWLKLQPDSSDRDLAVAGFASTLARTDPAGALEWANSIPDPKVRAGAMKNIAVRWLKADAAKAEAWIAGVAEFSEGDKRFIHSMASLRGDYLALPVTVGTRR